MPAEDSNRHRQIERRTFFFQIGWSQIDNDALVRCPESVVTDRRKNSIPGFPDRRIRQADDNKLSVASSGNVDFDIDKICLDAIDSSTPSFEKHVGCDGIVGRAKPV